MCRAWSCSALTQLVGLLSLSHHRSVPAVTLAHCITCSNCHLIQRLGAIHVASTGPPTIPVLPPAPDGGCVAVVIRTGFGTSQVRLCTLVLWTGDCVSLAVLLAHVLSPSGSARLFTQTLHLKWGRTFVSTDCVSTTVFGSTHAISLSCCVVVDWFVAPEARTLSTCVT
jgi:hypothetical protein